MSTEIPTHFVQAYGTNVQFLLQERGGKLTDTVTVNTYTGAAGAAVEQIGAVKARKKTVRHADTPLIGTPAGRRWVYPSDYEWADLIDSQDKLRLLIDPQSSYVLNGVNAIRRSQDDEILGAFYATAKTGEKGTVDTIFDATQVVGPTVGATGNTGLNVAKLRAAKKLLMQNHVDIENDPLFVAVTASDHDSLLAETQVISLDYNTRPVLVEGKITAFMGFNFKHIEFTDEATFDAAASMKSGSTRYLPCWAKSGMHLGVWEDVVTKVDPRADKSYATQVYVKGTYGGTRVEEKKVIRIDCVG